MSTPTRAPALSRPAEPPPRPGLIALLGSGETSPAGRKLHDYLLARLPRRATVAILETPAGFQPNVELVAAKICEFLRHGLRNYDPRVLVVPARERGTAFDPDNPQVAHYVLPADYIFFGPGSPTYAARQLRDSLTLQHVLTRHREGALLGLASAAALAAGRWVLPVYEIYKVGAALHWQAGLDLFAAYGLELAVVTHWNNREGGKDLDTSHCYMGRERFERLRALLPPTTTVLGIDEQVSCVVDPASGEVGVFGPGGVEVIVGERRRRFETGAKFGLELLRGGA